MASPTPRRTKCRLKLMLGQEIRVLTVPRDVQWCDLNFKICEEYGPVSVKYRDEENDLVTLSCQEDLEEAFQAYEDRRLHSLRLLLSQALEGLPDELPPFDPTLGDLPSSESSTSFTQDVRESFTYEEEGTATVFPPDGSIRHAPIRWQKMQEIGGGTFGQVYLAMDLDCGHILAVKQVVLGSSNREQVDENVRALQRDIDILSSLDHPNVVKYYGCERTTESFNLFMEFVPGGSVEKLLSAVKSFNESVIRMYTRQILLGLHYLHSQGIIHRDIKGGNILVDTSGQLKLTDFGCSKRLEGIANTSSGCVTLRGTIQFMAPEVIQQEDYGRKADVWSLGATVFQMATGHPPWHDTSGAAAIMWKIVAGKALDLPSNLSPDGLEFLRLCFRKDKSERPDVTQLLSHPFVQVAVPQSPHRVIPVSPASSPPGLSTPHGFGAPNDPTPLRVSSQPVLQQQTPDDLPPYVFDEDDDGDEEGEEEEEEQEEDERLSLGSSPPSFDTIIPGQGHAGLRLRRHRIPSSSAEDPSLSTHSTYRRTASDPRLDTTFLESLADEPKESSPTIHVDTSGGSPSMASSLWRRLTGTLLSCTGRGTLESVLPRGIQTHSQGADIQEIGEALRKLFPYMHANVKKTSNPEVVTAGLHLEDGVAPPLFTT